MSTITVPRDDLENIFVRVGHLANVGGEIRLALLSPDDVDTLTQARRIDEELNPEISEIRRWLRDKLGLIPKPPGE